jgi:hypothetical protein
LLVRERGMPAVAVPPQYEEIDVGDERPVRSLKTGLWLMERDGARYAVLLSPAVTYGRVLEVRFQIATFNNTQGAAISERFLTALERTVNDCPYLAAELAAGED